ncbi:DegT/DnrJ/EryC1/StrS family aminotransferase [Streptomyces zingiberis]|uniref:DegT/DnrJ/EryC1/StrS aminotransferase n=1 Tax=Streptomyces zingiberis TaxID=2053010 RepID=A0ABX1BXT2_9ACTN|nr:DegT/DnrJ/EryC1/StrS family aminotransferase [Streptomyces zingiberis]NJQ01913.1 DegT/DnrJ/EryC1/StrS aminotransferase [Streptomyces zingiberis]
MGRVAERLERALTGSGIGLGDEVIVPSFVAAEVAEAVRSSGATAVFADIGADTYCLSPDEAAGAVTARTAAIVPVHRFGHRADLARLGEVARRHGLLLLDQEEDESPAADTLRRQANAAYLTARLKGVETPRVLPGAGHTYHQYVVRVPGNGRPDRDAFALLLRGKGIPCRVPVPTPVHRTRDFREEGSVRGPLPETDRAADACLALPAGAQLGRRELQRVVSACNALGGLLGSLPRPRGSGRTHSRARV